MNNLKKESGLYFDSDGVFVTEREYIKEWCREIVGDSGDNFYERHGFDYDLDDDEVYEGFLWDFDYQIQKNRKDSFTIDLDNTDLQHSRVSLPNEDGLWDFEDCDFETTCKILDGLNIEYKSGQLDCDFDVNDNYDCEDFILYIDKGELVIKSEVTNYNFTLREFIDYNVERLNDSPSYEISKQDITERVINGLDKSILNIVKMDSIDVDKSTDLYAMFEMKYADSDKAKTMNEDKFYIFENIVFDSELNHISEDEMTLDDVKFTDLIKDQCESEKYSDVPFDELKHKNTKLENGTLYTTFVLDKNTSKTFTLAINPELENRSSILLNSEISKNEKYFDEFIKDSDGKYNKCDSKESLAKFMCVKYKKNAEKLKESEKNKSESYDKPDNDEKNVRRSRVSI